MLGNQVVRRRLVSQCVRVQRRRETSALETGNDASLCPKLVPTLFAVNSLTQTHVQTLNSVVAAMPTRGHQQTTEGKPAYVLFVCVVVRVVDQHQAEQLPVHRQRLPMADVADPQRGAPAPRAQRVGIEIDAGWFAHAVFHSSFAVF